MANNISFRVSVAKGLRLPYNLTGVTYDATAPDKDHHKAVTQVASGAYGPTAELAGAGDRVDGALLVVEPSDGASVKGTVDVAEGGTVVWLRYTGTAPAIGDAVMGATGTGGDTGDGFVTTGVVGTNAGARGRVVEVDTTNREVGVIF